MKRKYDFSQGERGAVEPTPPGKTRITIRIDNETLDWFRGKVNEQGGGNYQTLMNQALHEFIEREDLEVTLRRVLREELGASKARAAQTALG
jgi:BrnA antitoxin of type II toxin-antitoxin system